MTKVVKQTLLTGIGVLVVAMFPLFGYESHGGPKILVDISSDVNEGFVLVRLNSVLSVSSPYTPEKVAQKIKVIVTAYSSTPDQTDDTPFITAAGTGVREGIVAANFLPMGTKIKIPDLYGDEIFVVEDRMHARKTYHVDIWFPTYREALNFGAKNTYIEVLEG